MFDSASTLSLANPAAAIPAKPRPRAKPLGRTKQSPGAATPTRAQFEAFEAMFDHFNRLLFRGELPPVLLNFSRHRRAYGFFAPERWEKERKGQSVRHEISLNPAMLKARPAVATASTLVHELCHLWQWEHGTPGKRGYHNREWAAKMGEVGLVPSSTGAPGGAPIGPHVSHYVDPEGPFVAAFEALPARARLPWLCEEPGPDSSRNKVGYHCPRCGLRVWGKPGLLVLCEGDDVRLVRRRRIRRGS